MRGGSLERDEDALAVGSQRHLTSTRGPSGAAAPGTLFATRHLQTLLHGPPVLPAHGKELECRPGKARLF